jgi:hypothetical protein
MPHSLNNFHNRFLLEPEGEETKGNGPNILMDLKDKGNMFLAKIF